MAGTAITWTGGDTANKIATRSMLNEITTDLRAIVVDIEILRAGLSDAEDWILEVNTDLETRLTGSEASFNAGDNADGVGESPAETTITSAALGDFVQVSLGVDLDDMIVTGYVVSANTVTAWLQNESGGNINLASTTVRYLVTPFGASALEGTVTAAVLSATAFDTASDMTGYDITIS